MTHSITVSSILSSRLRESLEPEQEIIDIIYPEEVTTLITMTHDDYEGFLRIGATNIDEAFIDNNGNGSIFVSYDIVYRTASSDEDEVEQKSMDIVVNYDQRTVITLEGEDE